MAWSGIWKSLHIQLFLKDDAEEAENGEQDVGTIVN